MLEILKSDIESQIRQVTKGRWRSSGDKFLGVWDERLCCPSAAELRTLIAPFYRDFGFAGGNEAYDCEDQSLAFAGVVRAEAARTGFGTHSLACGMVMGLFEWVNSFTELHMCCWAAIQEANGARLYLLEPQRRPPTGALGDWLMPFDRARDIRLMFV